MEMIHNLGVGFELLMGWRPLATIFGGVCLGIMVGAMPGLSPSMGIALLVPLTYAMDPMLAIVLLAAMHLAADFGGSITAVTINTPGTPGSVATTFDGYALTRAGRPGYGLGVSLVASTMGGIFGTLVLIFLSQPLSRWAMSFQPAEYFAVGVFGLTSVATLGGDHRMRALMMVGLGLVINAIGYDSISGVSRFTYGWTLLDGGFSLIPMLIGLFAISEVFVRIESADLRLPERTDVGTMWPRWIDYWRLRFTILRASLVGIVIGICPGAGRSIASLVAYDIEKRWSREPETFGRGNLAGVAASEAANSSCIGGDMIPMLTLGIPGSASTAVMIGALMIHDVVPGPRLIEEHPAVVYGLFASQLVANVAILVLGLLGARFWVRVTRIPEPILFTLIPAAAALGCYSARQSMFDVATCFGFGLLGWCFRRYNYPIVPMVLGLVLGTLVEESFRQAVLMGGYGVFVRRPICLIVLILALAPVVYAVVAHVRRRP
jgi:putative tricarboxylic transport membrane protein